MRYHYIGAGPLALVAVCVVGGCSDLAGDCKNTDTCATTGGASGAGGDSGLGGTSGSGGQGGTGGGDGGTCDTTKSPSEESCLVADEHAVFVDGTASSTGSGSKNSPFKTISEGLTAAKSSGKIVLVCNTTYDERLTIDGGAKLYGGFDCGAWAYAATGRPEVKPTTRGIVLDIDAASAPVVIEDINFEAMDASDPGESSITAFVKNSSDAALARVNLVAGKGAKGKDGTLQSVTQPSAASLKGNSATADTGGAVKSCICPAGGTTIGGTGGNGGVSATGGGPGQTGTLGGGGSAGKTCTSGQDGSAGAGDQHGTGAATLGSLTSGGWTATSGAQGTVGAPGQGGGGGGGSTDGGGGGSGGCGGCGGAAASGGDGGGASIALLVLDSNVSVAQSQLASDDAGAGGKGVAGQPGQSPGGARGNGDNFGCQGGIGGPGGNGGAGGGGAGGVSAGIVHKGTAPTVDSNTTITPGKKGAPGIGGKPGSNDGIDGLAQDVVEVK